MRSSTDPAPLACRTVARSARPRPSSRATATTVAPRRANSLAVAFPRAPVAPVTMQTRPTRLPAAPAMCRGGEAAINISFALYEAGHPFPQLYPTNEAVLRAGLSEEDLGTATVKSLDCRISNGRKRDRPSRVDSTRRAWRPRARINPVVPARRRRRDEWHRGRERTSPSVRHRAILLRPRGERPCDPDGSPRDRGPWPPAGERPGAPERFGRDSVAGSRCDRRKRPCVVRVLRRRQGRHLGPDHRTDEP